jgi:hypothetical protein
MSELGWSVQALDERARCQYRDRRVGELYPRIAVADLGEPRRARASSARD